MSLRDRKLIGELQRRLAQLDQDRAKDQETIAALKEENLKLRQTLIPEAVEPSRAVQYDNAGGAHIHVDAGDSAATITKMRAATVARVEALERLVFGDSGVGEVGDRNAVLVDGAPPLSFRPEFKSAANGADEQRQPRWETGFKWRGDRDQRNQLVPPSKEERTLLNALAPHVVPNVEQVRFRPPIVQGERASLDFIEAAELSRSVRHHLLHLFNEARLNETKHGLAALVGAHKYRWSVPPGNANQIAAALHIADNGFCQWLYKIGSPLISRTGARDPRGRVVYALNLALLGEEMPTPPTEKARPWLDEGGKLLVLQDCRAETPGPSVEGASSGAKKR